MSGSSVSKSPIKKSRQNGNNVDHISSLHASVISYILSRLSTKEAVRTSVLSKDWKFKWTDLHSFQFDDTIIRAHTNEREENFANFVNSVLRYSHNITNFTLRSQNRCNPSRLSTWISEVLAHKVERFEVLVLIPHTEEESIVLPFGLITRNSLRKLELKVLCVLNNLDAKSCFPNLKSMHLFGVQFLNENSNFDTLSLTFPVLEILDIQNCKWVNVKFLEIYAPALATFISKTSSNSYGVRGIQIKLSAPKLVKFECRGLPETIVMDGGLQVVCALLCCGSDQRDDVLFRDVIPQMRKLLDTFSNLEELTVSNFMAEVLLSGGRTLQRYKKLKQLIIYCPGNNEQLFELLHAAPRLKYLSVNLCRWNDYEYDRIESVPSCIVSYLEEIETIWFLSKEPQNKFVKFLFQNGGVLKKLSFKGGHDATQKEQIIVDLSKLPRIQTSLTISFSHPESVTVLT